MMVRVGLFLLLLTVDLAKGFRIYGVGRGVGRRSSRLAMAVAATSHQEISKHAPSVDDPQ